ncbi:hypothetical protein CONLIGDRAFT_667736 [Coniochaeta ligniaria NRRL 30616]|uniref:Zn(2)-C6 fungal-type domain-containing protein n=1 Tax=Coniochaeta ligniaria NRRL 30616 TaxID=1408157 RepID=A0A1J7IX78_9PEZI|nr:hypothetical protein CONLIGDRAFT_667736 [Coniochaeta ligniaria NRRL 30616]
MTITTKQPVNMTEKAKKRTRTGCITCKIRRVKCDETKPSCNRCLAQKRICDGYPPPSTSHRIPTRRALAAAVLTLSTPGPASRILAGPTTASDAACFDFFRARTAPMTASLFPSEFWGTRLLQVAHGEPAVWHAAVALGALHRRWELGFAPPSREWEDGDGMARFSEKAAGAYARSVAMGRDINDPVALLVLSLGLMAVTNIMGRWVDNRVHGAAGARLLGEIKRERAGCRRGGRLGSEIESVAESFARMDLQNLTFSESQAPYPDVESVSNEDVVAEADSLEDVLVPGERFDSFSQAGFHLFALNRRFLLLAAIGEKMSLEEYTAFDEGVRYQLMLWEQMTKNYLRQTRIAEKDTPGLLTLKLYHAFLCLFFRAGVTGPQTDWDTCLPHFERIVALAGVILGRNRTSHAAPAFVSLEPGVIIPLYLTATRCRHPVLRRRALELLRGANSQEGRWHSVGAAAVAERMMQIEEEGLRGIIPEESYLDMVALDVSKDKGFHKCAERNLAEETEEYWLGGDENWTTTHSWDGIVSIPEESRLVMTGITADTESGRIELDLVFSGGETVESQKTEEVVIVNWQAKWTIERSIL